MSTNNLTDQLVHALDALSFLHYHGEEPAHLQGTPVEEVVRRALHAADESVSLGARGS